MTRRFFGTDGIRGRVGKYPMTPDFVLKLGWAAGRVLTDHGRSLVLIGKDTRISGYMMESALYAGLSAAGADIRLLGPMPTPAIAYLTRTLRASAGIVISASHNPYYDNGVKFFSAQGEKLNDAIEREIEAQLDKPLEMATSDHLGKAERVVDAGGRYIEFCKSTIPYRTMLLGLKIVVDCANGATYHVAPDVLKELGAEVVAIGVSPNGTNINDDCGATSPQQLQSAVLKHRADLGIALDGDGDRLIMVDDQGDVMDGDEILGVLASVKKQDGSLQGGVIGTQMSNLGLEIALNEAGIDFARAKVGDRYVMEMMREKQWLLGGESSGHIICLDVTTTGDGIISALQVLRAMIETGRSLRELRKIITKFPQVLINVPIAGAGSDVLTLPRVRQAVADVEAQLGDRGRVLLRPSGTEPLIRVMVEGEDESEVRGLAENIASAVSDSLELD